jgi:hypothetical protein
MRSIDLKHRGRARPRIGPALALPALFAFTLGLAACADEPTRPSSRGGDGDGGARTPPRPLGVVEITISGLGSGHVTSSALSAPTVAELDRLRALRNAAGASAAGPGVLAPQALTPPDHTGGGGDGTIQLELLSTGSFTDGARGAGGYRYLWATYRVRNAQKDGTAYDTPRMNLTFYAVDTDETIGETAISSVMLFDGSPADPALATQLIPTGAVAKHPGSNTVHPTDPDVLQVVTEAEADSIRALAGEGVTDVFPYGFVVRRVGSTTTRELPANPDEDRFDGIVTFAYKVPLQATPAQDPFTVTIMFLAVDDDEVKITQSVEEATSAGIAAFDARATSLGATRIRLLPWGTSASSSYERFCSVRIAGPASNPTAYLASAPGNLVSLSPHPFTASASSVPVSAQFTATFDRAVGGVSPRQGLVVHGSHSGRRFVGKVFAGHGTTTISTPVAHFFPGEEVEVGFAPSIRRSACADAGFPGTFRYRVATSPSTGSFTAGSPIQFGQELWSVALGDLDADGHLDMVVADKGGAQVLVWRNQGGGTFAQTPDVYSIPSPSRLALGDLDGDGDLDVVVLLFYERKVHVLLNQGNGTFSHHATSSTAPVIPRVLSLGDLDGDGDLDLVVHDIYKTDILVYPNAGDGTFDEPAQYTAKDLVGNHALGDVDGDGYLDLVVTLAGSHEIEVFRNRGDGTFESDAAFSAGGQRPIPVAVGDLNQDGFPDLVVGHDLSSTVSVFLNDGNGTFAMAGAPYPVGDERDPWWIVLGDVDGDGDVDIVVTSAYASEIHVLRNEGNGQFTVEGPLAFAPGGADVSALGDLDGDGDLDLAVVSSGSGSVVVYTNQ